MPELKNLNTQSSRQTLEDLLTLRDTQPEGESFYGCFNHEFYERVADAYVTLLLANSTRGGPKPLDFIHDYIDRFGQDKYISQALVKGAANYGGGYPPDELRSFLRAYAFDALRLAPADAITLARMIGEHQGLGVDVASLQEITTDKNWPRRLLALMILANDPGLNDPRAFDRVPDGWLEDTVIAEWEKLLTQWRESPEQEVWAQRTRITWLGEAVSARPSPRYKPLIIETMRYETSVTLRLVLKELGITDAEGKQLLAILDNPLAPPRCHTHIIDLLVDLNYRPAAPYVRAYVEQYHLETKDDPPGSPQFYPRLQTDSRSVSQWVKWLEHE